MIGFIICIFISLSVPVFCLLRGTQHTTLKPALGSVVVLLLVTGLLYGQTTSLRQIFEWRQAVKEAPALLSEMNSLSTLQQRQVALALRTRLYEEPDNAREWELLGKMQLALSHPGEALAAFSNSWRLMPSDLNIALNYAAALIETGESSDIEQAAKILTRLDSRYPGNTKIMSQLAYAALSQQDFPRAAMWFKRIMSQLPANDPRREFIQAMLKTLEQRKQGSK